MSKKNNFEKAYYMLNISVDSYGLGYFILCIFWLKSVGEEFPQVNIILSPELAKWC